MSGNDEKRKPRQDSGTSEQIEKVLSRFMETDGVRGVSIIDRRGTALFTRGAANIDSKLLHPMIATLAGAGHIAVAELEAKPDVRVVARSDRTRIHIAGIDEEHLLVTVADNTKAWATIKPRVDETRVALRNAYAQ